MVNNYHEHDGRFASKRPSKPTETPMAERVARAICRRNGIDPDRKGNEAKWRWQEFMDDAAAAIEEMRIPDEAMENAWSGPERWNGDALGIWQDMIDAALGKVRAPE